jgi:NTE family protein
MSTLPAAIRQRPSPPAAAGREPSFAVGFGGGGARGRAHIHVIEALDELGVRPAAISGSSIGAIMGAGMAAGMSVRDMHAYVRAILGDRAQVASRLWRSRRGSFREVVSGDLRFIQFDIERVLKAFLPDALPESFAALQIPLKVTATDFFAHEPVVFEEGDLVSALAASAAIPALFRPVRRGGRVLIDGGIYDPVPFGLIEGAADIIIAIDVVGAPAERRVRLPKSIDLMFGASQLMMQSIIAMKLDKHRPSIFLRPPVSRFRVLDFMKVDAVMAESVSIKDDLKRAIEAAVESHSGRLPAVAGRAAR